MTQPRGRFWQWCVLTAVAVTLLAVSIHYRDHLAAWLRPAAPAPVAEQEASHPHEQVKVLELSKQARENLQLVSRPVKVQTYWKSILVPGQIVDRPGLSDRGVSAPAVSVVTQVHAFPGDTVHPGDKLFTLRLLSEYIQNTQLELFKATGETVLIREQQDRLKKATDTGAIPQSRLIELDQQLRRQETAMQGLRQDLLTRGLSKEQIDEVTQGKFVASIDVVAPPRAPRPQPGRTQPHPMVE